MTYTNNRHAYCECKTTNRPADYHYKNWSKEFRCESCGRIGKFNLNYLGQRKIYCDGNIFIKSHPGDLFAKTNQSGSTATDLLIVTVGLLSIGALAFTVAGLPALILLKTLAEMLR